MNKLIFTIALITALAIVYAVVVEVNGLVNN
jgi:hypothetical protein